MNRNSSFARKAVLIGVIVALLIPLSIIARPASRATADNRVDSGGILATQRIAYDLSQAKLGEVDPASETMKLVSLGFRSIAATSLWLSSIDAQEKKDWDRLAATANTLIKVQPNFTRVWEFMAHNLSYNTSVEFDDYEERYRWVKKGLDLLTEGMAYNRLNHRFTDQLGWFTGHKIGTADEKLEYRRLFRNDSEYHDQLDRYFDRNSYDDKYYGKDNWLLAYQWYLRSVAMVDAGIDGEKAKRQIGELLFYMYPPTQLRLHVTGLQAEFPPEEIFKVKWENAARAWEEFGKRTLRNPRGVTYNLDGLMSTELELASARQELDALAPAGMREKVIDDWYEKTGVPENSRRLLRTPLDQLSESELVEVRNMRKVVEDVTRGLDEYIYGAIPPEKKAEADKQLLRISRATEILNATDINRHTANFSFWKIRNNLEQSEEALTAHQFTYDAEEKSRESIYADFSPLDAQTQQPDRTKEGQPMNELGAIRSYEQALGYWSDQAKAHPVLADSAFMETAFENAGKVAGMLRELGRPWPRNFRFQEMVDRDESTAQRHGVPTTKELAEGSWDGLPELPSIEF